MPPTTVHNPGLGAEWHRKGKRSKWLHLETLLIFTEDLTDTKLSLKTERQYVLDIIYVTASSLILDGLTHFLLVTHVRSRYKMHRSVGGLPSLIFLKLQLGYLSKSLQISKKDI